MSAQLFFVQVARLGLHAEQRVPGAHPEGDVYQDVPAPLHHVEPLTADVLQVGIAGGAHGGRAGRWAGRRGSRHGGTDQ